MMGNGRGQHPKPVELLRYSEGLVDGHVHMAPEIVRHVSECKRCRKEVDAMRRSLEATGLDSGIEPSEEWTQSLLNEARRQEWQNSGRPMRIAAGVAAAVVLAALAGSARFVPENATADYAADAPPESLLSPVEAPVVFATEPNFPIQPLLETSLEELILQDAILAPGRRPTNHWEAAQLRAIEAIDVDIEEGLAALKANPGLVSARQLVNSSRQRKVELLRTFYLERSL